MRRSVQNARDSRRQAGSNPRPPEYVVPKRPSSTKTVSSRAASADLKAARKRIEGLEAREAERARAEQVQAALYRIAETASAATQMPSVYAAIQRAVGGLLYAGNVGLAPYD